MRHSLWPLSGCLQKGRKETLGKQLAGGRQPAAGSEKLPLLPSLGTPAAAAFRLPKQQAQSDRLQMLPCFRHGCSRVLPLGDTFGTAVGAGCRLGVALPTGDILPAGATIRLPRLLLLWKGRVSRALRTAPVGLPLPRLLLRLLPLASGALSLLLPLRLLRLLAARLAAAGPLVRLPGTLAALVAQRVLPTLRVAPPLRRAGGAALGARAGGALPRRTQRGNLNRWKQGGHAAGGGRASAATAAPAAAAPPPPPAPAEVERWRKRLGGQQAQHHAAARGQAQLIIKICAGGHGRWVQGTRPSTWSTALPACCGGDQGTAT